MTAQIYPGLSAPKSQLFFDPQALIAENGGRLRLALILEAEREKTFWRRKKAMDKIRIYMRYTPE